jgi:hypothetical protein
MTRPNRRATDGGPYDAPLARRRRLVRHIAADPVLVDWLATSKARTLLDAAALLDDREAAETIRRYADELTSGRRSPLS